MVRRSASFSEGVSGGSDWRQVLLGRSEGEDEEQRPQIGRTWITVNIGGRLKKAQKGPKKAPESPSHENTPENFAFVRGFGGSEGTRTPDPLHAMQVRYQLRHSPELLLLCELFSRVSPEQLKYLRTAIPKIPNRAYSADSRASTPSRWRRQLSPRCRRRAGGPPRGSPSTGAPARRRRGLLHAGRG
jgi:hypothetical protein